MTGISFYSQIAVGEEQDRVAALDYMQTNYGAKIIKTSQLINLISK